MCDIFLFIHPIFNKIEFLNSSILNLTLTAENSNQHLSTIHKYITWTTATPRWITSWATVLKTDP